MVAKDKFIKVTVEVMVRAEMYRDFAESGKSPVLYAASLVNDTIASEAYSEVDDCRVVAAEPVTDAYYCSWSYAQVCIERQDFPHFYCGPEEEDTRALYVAAYLADLEERATPAYRR